MSVLCCSGEDEAGCKGIYCGPQGYCEEVDGGWTCVCYEEYYTKIDGKCYGGQRICGEECEDDNLCISGWCYKPVGYEVGYCVERGCATNDSCSSCSHAKLPLCCVEYSSGYHACLGIVNGAECGAQDKVCGESCAGQLQSACMPGLNCLRLSDEDPDAFCARRCESDEDCADCGAANVCRAWYSILTFCQPG
ncbi:MAG: hypothetical protein JRF33_25845 [Deltaproteobacteria bacterium]|nr:hypothetical protein [Deltaproteobacteria bacterium]